jgi:hypothetical protein
MVMKTIVALPGQGHRPRGRGRHVRALDLHGPPLKILTPPQGNPLPEETKRAAREADGVLFGAHGHGRRSAAARRRRGTCLPRWRDADAQPGGGRPRRARWPRSSSRRIGGRRALPSPFRGAAEHPAVDSAYLDLGSLGQREHAQRDGRH